MQTTITCLQLAKMSSAAVQKWDYLDCNFMCVDVETMQTHLEQQHSYEAAVSPESHSSVLVAVIASRLHDEECAWQTDAEIPPKGDCVWNGWECSISDVHLLQRRTVVEK